MLSLDPKNFVSKETTDQKAIDNLRGIKDSRGPIGILSRGKNIYNGGSTAAHSGGGPQFGRPANGSMQQHDNAIARRLGQK